MAIEYKKWDHGKKNLKVSIDKLTKAVGLTLTKQLGPVYNDYEDQHKKDLEAFYKSLQGLQEDVDNPYYGEKIAVKEHLATLEKSGKVFDYKVGDKTFGDVIAEYMTDDNLTDKKDILTLHLKKIDDQLGSQLLSPEKRQDYEERVEATQLGYYKKDAKLFFEKDMKNGATALTGIDSLKKSITSGAFEKNAPGVQRTEVLQVLAARKAVGSERGVKSSLKRDLSYDDFEKTYIELAKDEKLNGFLDTLEIGQIQKAMGEGHGGALEDIYRQYNATQSVLPSDLDQRYAPSVGQRMEFLQNKLKGVSKEEDRIRYTAELKVCQELGQTKEDLNKPINCEDFNTRAAGKYETVRQELANAPKEEVADELPKDKKGKPLTARQCIRLLQKQIESKEFAAYDPKRKRETYVKLLAIRMAVNSKRGVKSSLDKPVSREEMAKATIILNTDKTVSKQISGNDEDLRRALLVGHGGAAEDLIRNRVDYEPTYDPNMPARFKPPCPKTYNEAAAELKKMAEDKENNRPVCQGRYDRYIAYTVILAKQNLNQQTLTQAADQLMATPAYKQFQNEWGKNPESLKYQVGPTMAMKDNVNIIWDRAAKKANDALQNAPEQPKQPTGNDQVKEEEQELAFNLGG